MRDSCALHQPMPPTRRSAAVCRQANASLVVVQLEHIQQMLPGQKTSAAIQPEQRPSVLSARMYSMQDYSGLHKSTLDPDHAA